MQKSTIMRKIIVLMFLISTVVVITLFSCSKENSSKSTTVKVRLTDNPVLADEVNVDIQQVRVKYSEDSISGWADLLGLQNGVDTLLAVGVIPSDEVKEIRFVLGSNNSIKVNGIVYPLTIPSGSESGLKLKIDKRLNGSLDSLLIDFDAALSIHQIGTGDYKLKPVLKLK